MFDSSDSSGLPTAPFAESVPPAKKGRKGKPREMLGNRTDLLRVYRKAKDFIVENHLLRLCTLETTAALTRMTICNLWRIERTKDDRISVFEFDLNRQSWIRCKAPEVPRALSKIPLWPIGNFTRWWRDLISSVVYTALAAAGYFELPEPTGEKQWSKNVMAEAMIRKYCGRPRKVEDGKMIFVDGFLKASNMSKGARLLRAVFWDHIREREIFSACLSINYMTAWTLADYVLLAQYRRGLLRVYRENRNLLPLLHKLHPKHWRHEDLFSRKRWVSEGRKKAWIGRANKQDKNKTWMPFNFNVGSFESFESPAGFRWLKTAPTTLVREFAEHKGSWRKNFVITQMALCNFTGRVPAEVHRLLFRTLMNLPTSSVQPMQLQRVLRALLAHCEAIWKSRGLKVLREYLKDAYHCPLPPQDAAGRAADLANASSLYNVFDFLVSEAGSAQPDKQATWMSLSRRTREWEEWVAAESARLAREKAQAYKALVWTSELGETKIDKFVFTPLTSWRALAAEGEEMIHCVANYARHCLQGNYRIFAVRGEASEPESRATLGLHILLDNVKSPKANLNQLYSFKNSAVSEPVRIAAAKLAKKYTEKLEEEWRKTAPSEPKRRSLRGKRAER